MNLIKGGLILLLFCILSHYSERHKFFTMFLCLSPDIKGANGEISASFDIVALVDLFVLQKTGNTPSSHTERFRVTEEKFQEVYDLLDKDFPFYQNSYFQIMSKELAEVIKNDTKIMAGKTKVKL